MKARFLIAERRKCMQRFYFQYQTEAMPKGISVEQFCLKNKVPYNIFSKWYRDTRKKIVEVQVDGKPVQVGHHQANPSEEKKKWAEDQQLIRQQKRKRAEIFDLEDEIEDKRDGMIDKVKAFIRQHITEQPLFRVHWQLKR